MTFFHQKSSKMAIFCPQMPFFSLFFRIGLAIFNNNRRDSQTEIEMKLLKNVNFLNRSISITNSI
jgi:hypothetical protein